MLDFMRRHAQSWMIKGALGAVAVVFIFWGIWTPRETRERDLAEIRGQIITLAEARNYYQNLRERYRSVYGEKFTDEMARKLGLKERAVKDLINKVLLLQEARRLGLEVSPEEIQAAIQNYPAFQKDGIFDKVTYLRALQQVRMTPQEFEANQKQVLLIYKAQNLIASSVKVSERETLDAYRETFEKINLELLQVSPADIKGISPSAEEEKDYFSKHREEFKIPGRVKIQYLLFEPKNYAGQVKISSQEVETYYQNNREKFTSPKRVKLRHILIKYDSKDPESLAQAKKKAEAVRQEALQGKDFTQLARQNSEDPGTKDRGGELGYISRGMVVPEIEEAAFALKAGGISNLIQTPFGLHILRADEIQEAKTEPLEKAKSQIESLLRDRKARELAQDEAEQAYASAAKQKGLEGFAGDKKLVLKETDFFSSGDQNNLDPKLKDAAFVLSKGEISPVLRLGQGFGVLQVVEKQEARTPELKEVQAKVAEAVRREKQREKAQAKAKEVLEKLKKGADFRSIAAQEGSKIEETGLFERGGDPPKMRASEELRKALPFLSLKTPYPENPILNEGSYWIPRLKEVKGIDQAQFNSQKENFRQSLLMQKQEKIINDWLNDRLEQAKAEGKFKMIKEANDAL